MSRRITGRYRQLAYVQLLVILFISLSVIAGWYFGIDFLKRTVAGSVSMNPVTALSFVLASVALLLHLRRKNNKPGLILAFIVLLIGVTRLMEIIFSLPTGISEWLFPGRLLTDYVNGKPNTMAPNTAFCFIIIGLSLIFFYRLDRRRIWSDYIACISLLISLFSLVGYLYRATEFYNVKSYIPMAFPTAFCFFILSLSLIMLNTETGLFRFLTTPFQGSRVARFLLPFAVLVPIISGKLRIYGQECGLYSSQFGTTLFVLLNVLLFFLLIWRASVSINRSNQSLIEQVKRTREISDQLYEEQKKDFELALMRDKIRQHKELIEATINGQEKEKKQIGMELHDHINQILASTRMYIEMARHDAALRNELLDKSAEQLAFAVNEIRNLSKSMVLHANEKGGIYQQIQEMIAHIGRSASLQFMVDIAENDFNALSHQQQVAVYRILEEQLNNIVKHAAAQNVNIEIRKENGNYHLQIRDDGKGFDMSQKRPGIGLSNISSRTDLLNGKLDIRSSPGAGFRMHITFPASGEE